MVLGGWFGPGMGAKDRWARSISNPLPDSPSPWEMIFSTYWITLPVSSLPSFSPTILTLFHLLRFSRSSTRLHSVSSILSHFSMLFSIHVFTSSTSDMRCSASLSLTCMLSTASLSSFVVSLIETTSVATTWRVALIFRISSNIVLSSNTPPGLGSLSHAGVSKVHSSIGLVFEVSLRLVAAPFEKISFAVVRHFAGKLQIFGRKLVLILIFNTGPQDFQTKNKVYVSKFT